MGYEACERKRRCMLNGHGMSTLRKHPLPAETSCPDGGVTEWRSHPRFKRHLRKFQRFSNPHAAFEKYRNNARECDRAALQRHTVHVAAWVSLLPVVEGAVPECAHLLGFLLKRRGKAQLSPLLHGILH